MFKAIAYFPISPYIRLGYNPDRGSDLRPMDKIDSLLLAIQQELRRHDWDTFQVELGSDDNRKVTVSGCPVCKKQVGTMPQFLDHLALDAVPALFARLRAKTTTL
jgi:hypothetical protein